MKPYLIKLALIVFAITFIFYLLTLPNTNPSFADSDELITAAKVFGVAHPPGYPLYVMLAGIFGMLPIPFLDFAGKVNLLSTLLHGLTIGVFFLSSFFLLQKFFKDQKVIIISSFLASFFVAFSYSFWFHSLIAEVFPLSSFLNSLVVLVLLFWSNQPLAAGRQNLVKRDSRLLVLAGLLFGLAMSNQQASLLLLPAYAFWVFIHQPKTFLNFRLMGFLIGVGLLGMFLPYIYVLIAASRNPFLNWENATNFEGLYRLITRAVYGEAAADGKAYLGVTQLNFGQIPLQVLHFINYLRNNLGFIPFAIGIFGIGWVLKHKYYRLLVLIGLGIVGSGLFFAIWDPIDFSLKGNSDFSIAVLIMRRFYTFSVFFYGLFAALGTAVFLQYMSRFNFLKAAVLSVGAIVLITGLMNFSNIKQNNFLLANSYAKSFFNSLDKNAILICITAENGCFQSYYLQQVEAQRPDVVIVPGDFKQRSLSQLKEQDPDLFRTTSKDPVVLIRDIIRWNIDKRPIYIMGMSLDVEWLSVLNVDGNPYYVQSAGCGVLKITKSYSLENAPETCGEIEKAVLAQESSSTNFYRQIYSSLSASHRFQNSLVYLIHDCVDQSKSQLEKALELNPDFVKAKSALDKINKDNPQNTKCPFGFAPVTVGDINKELEKPGDDPQKKIYYGFQLTMLDPKNIDYRLNLAQEYAKNNFIPLAKLEYSDILNLDPSNTKAKEGLDGLIIGR